MAISREECLRMIDAADSAGRVGAIAYTYRGYPLIEVLRGKVADGDFGTLRRLGGCYLSQDVQQADKYVWLFTPDTTGRSYALMDLGVHWLDLAEYVTGQKIIEITAQFSTHQPSRVWRGHMGRGQDPRVSNRRMEVSSSTPLWRNRPTSSSGCRPALRDAPQ
jgi:predicted dehydrogenase